MSHSPTYEQHITQACQVLAQSILPEHALEQPVLIQLNALLIGFFAFARTELEALRHESDAVERARRREALDDQLGYVKERLMAAVQSELPHSLARFWAPNLPFPRQSAAVP